METITFTNEDIALTIDELRRRARISGVSREVEDILDMIKTQSAGLRREYVFQVSALLNIHDESKLLAGDADNLNNMTINQLMQLWFNQPRADLGNNSPYEVMTEDPRHWIPTILKSLTW